MRGGPETDGAHPAARMPGAGAATARSCHKQVLAKGAAGALRERAPPG
eukprot:CAMPEP_0206000256 /NCGR_PEP_ID=MMETSP1464-20131121/1357_1 /ASSEMBLY_ACC=CAM_ASM_001124 /TAXON_ID=119497 /ORGANISM="Exanthemachrysis gayraliae, Strain RCC1523" /LENGTH=47 /DNA_ID= /DNA_START= /DNA_END= /DNA_ORIENTATION=